MSSGAARWSAVLTLAALLTVPGSAAEPFDNSAHSAKRSVAITFDDLPAAKNSFDDDLLSRPEAFLRHNQGMLQKLRRMKVPVAGFVSSSFQPEGWSLEDLHALLEAWEKGGASLGNHTTTHGDYHEMKSEAYFADILHGQQLLESALGKQPAGQKYFRAPYLHRGRNQAERERLAEYLDEHSYTIAPVTIDLQDWMFAEVYAWADSHHDTQRKQAVVAAYLAYLDASIEYYALLSTSILGRQAPHVALLHANALNYDHIEEVVGRFRQRGFEFISLETAMLDPVFREMPAESGSWIRGWQQEKGLPIVAAPAPNRFLGSLYADFLRNRR